MQQQWLMQWKREAGAGSAKKLPTENEGIPPLKRRPFKKNTWKSSNPTSNFQGICMDMLILGRVYLWDTWWCFITPKVYCSCDWNFHPRHVPRFHGPKSGRCNFSKRRKNPRSHRTVNFIGLSRHITSGRISCHFRSHVSSYHVHIISRDPSRWLVCEQSNLFKRQKNADC